MSNDFTNDGSEQFSYLELHNVFDAIKAKRIDPRQVYRTPADEPGVQTTRISFRLHKNLVDAIDVVVHHAERFKDRSEFMRHVVVLGLACEAYVADIHLPVEPAIIWASQQREMAIQKTIDEIIVSTRTRVTTIDGDGEREELWNDLMSLMDYCKSRGWNRRVEEVRRTLMMIRPAGIE